MEFPGEFWKPSFLDEPIEESLTFAPSMVDPFPQMGEDVLQVPCSFSLKDAMTELQLIGTRLLTTLNIPFDDEHQPLEASGKQLRAFLRVYWTSPMLTGVCQLTLQALWK